MKKRTPLYFCTLALFAGVYFSPPLYAADSNKGLERIEETKFKQEQKVAVVVGVGAYDANSGLRRLAYATNDANGIANALRQQGYSVRLLINHQANKGYILSAIKQAGNLLKKGEGTLIFVYSGHGFSNGNINYLASYGTTIDRLSSSALTLREVENEIRKTKARRAMLFIDSCRDNPEKSGNKSVRNHGFSPSQSYGLKRLQATQDGNVSTESSELGHGVFSYYLIKALKGEAADRTGLITFRGIENYVKTNVSKWSYQHGKTRAQIPVSRGNSSGVLVLGRKRGTHPAKIVNGQNDSGHQVVIIPQGEQGKRDHQQQFVSQLTIIPISYKPNSLNSRFYQMYNSAKNKKGQELFNEMRVILRKNNFFWPALLAVANYYHSIKNYDLSSKYYNQTIDALNDETKTLEEDMPPIAIIRSLMRNSELDLLAANAPEKLLTIKKSSKLNLSKKSANKLHMSGLHARPKQLPIHFSPRKNKLSDHDLRYIQKVYQSLHRKGDPNIKLIGHTSPEGKASINLKLSIERAKIVKDFLLSKNYEGRILATGKGEMYPLYDPRGKAMKFYGKHRWYRMLDRVEIQVY